MMRMMLLKGCLRMSKLKTIFLPELFSLIPGYDFGCFQILNTDGVVVVECFKKQKMSYLFKQRKK
jgi:hypothetical protein